MWGNARAREPGPAGRRVLTPESEAGDASVLVNVCRGTTRHTSADVSRVTEFVREKVGEHRAVVHYHENALVLQFPRASGARLS